MKNFNFKGYWNTPSVCGVDLYHQNDDKVVVVLTELPDNHGTSVTNAIELIAEQATEAYGLQNREVVWIEHYPEQVDPYNDRKIIHENSFDLVEMAKIDNEFFNPQWKRISEVEFVKLTME